MRPSRSRLVSSRRALVVFGLSIATRLKLGATQYENCTGTVSTTNDGACDDDNNVVDCAYDGGDCCPSTCTSTGTDIASTCVDNTKDCLDPDASDYPYAAYGNCTGSLSTVDDGSCDSNNNNADCAYDGGDCCPSTCDANDCLTNTSSCADPDASDFGFAGFEKCTGYLPDTGDGRCDSENNNAECGYDGGDCCLCTCSSSTYTCGSSSYNCLDPDGTIVCSAVSLLDCGDDIPKEWVVEDTAGAADLAAAINCSGGEYDVKWIGEVTVGQTIWVAGGTSLNITGATSLGEAIANGDGRVQLFRVVKGSLHISDLQLSTGSATNGGAIFADASVVTLTHAFFSNNTASQRGGALFADAAASVSWSGGTSFVDNTAGWDGGAVHISESSVTWAGESQTLFFNNRVTGAEGENGANYGGAIRAKASSNVSWSGPTRFSKNRIVTSTDAETPCFGGALSAEGGSRFDWSSKTSFDQNEACECGGAVFANSSSSFTWSGDDSNFTRNEAGSGGAVCLGERSNATWSSTTAFSDNYATLLDGGAIFATKSAYMSWSGVGTVFNNNTAVEDGGAVYVRDHSTLTYSGETNFTNNTADDGGAIGIGAMATVSYTGTTLISGNVAHSDGGALYASMRDDVDLATLVVNGATAFRNNTCGSYGGAIMFGGAVTTTFGDSPVKFKRNSAGSAGGAVFLSGVGIGPRFMSVTFVGNSAQVGGAVYATGSGTTYSPDTDQSFATLYERCTFEGNRATATGGAMESAAGRDLMVNSTFIDNKAQEGGALRLAGFATISGCIFEGNRAEEDGGPAVSTVGFTSQMANCSFFDNVFICPKGSFLEYGEGDRYEAVCNGCSACEGDCEIDDLSSAPICSDALEHTTSSGGSITLETLRVEKGYWRATNTSKDIKECFNLEACNGGVTGAASNCTEGYEGPYCSVCGNGYAKALAFRCSECSSRRGVIFVAVMAPLTAVVLAALIIFLVAKQPGRYSNAPEGRFQRLRNWVPLNSMKIVIVSWQIMTSISSVGNVTFPGIYQGVLDGLELLNFDVGWALSTGGCFAVDFHDRLLTCTIGPILCTCLLGVTYKVARFRNRRSSEALQKVRHRHATMFLWMTFLIYSSVSSIVFQTFSCEHLDDGNEYLRADYQIECTSPKHKLLEIYAGLMIVVYPLGIPVFYTAVLVWGRDAWKIAGVRNRHDAHVQAAAVLTRPYRSGCFYYEVIECARRALLTGAVVFIFPNSPQQLAVTLVMACTFSLVYEALAPYISVWDAWIARAGHIIVLLSVFVAFLIRVGLSTDTGDSSPFGAVLVAVNIMLILAVIVEGISIAISMRTGGERRVSQAVHAAVPGFGFAAVGFGNAADGFFPPTSSQQRAPSYDGALRASRHA